MAVPTVSDTTLGLYEEMPEHYRAADVPLDYPLLRFLAAIGDQADEIVRKLALLDAGAMGDPANAPTEWIRWMAQFVALDTTGLTPPEIRFGIDTGQALLNGSMESLRRTIEGLLGGEKRYILVTHAGDPFAIAVYVNVDDAGGSTWDTLALTYPSWDAWEAVATWDDLATVSPINERANLVAVTPAWIDLTIELLPEGSMWLFYELSVLTWDQLAADFPTWDDFEAEVFAWQ
jgi:hypothetical protein